MRCFTIEYDLLFGQNHVTATARRPTRPATGGRAAGPSTCTRPRPHRIFAAIIANAAASRGIRSYSVSLLNLTDSTLFSACAIVWQTLEDGGCGCGLVCVCVCVERATLSRPFLTPSTTRRADPSAPLSISRHTVDRCICPFIAVGPNTVRYTAKLGFSFTARVQPSLFSANDACLLTRTPYVGNPTYRRATPSHSCIHTHTPWLRALDLQLRRSRHKPHRTVAA